MKNNPPIVVIIGIVLSLVGAGIVLLRPSTSFSKYPVDAGSACSDPCCQCAMACAPNHVLKCGSVDKNTYCTCAN